MTNTYKGYLNPSVTIDVVLFTIQDDKLKVLLLKRDKSPFKDKLALPGGFLLKNETMEMGVSRIIKDKVGIDSVYTEQLYTFGDLDRDPRGPVFSIAYFALIPESKIENRKAGLYPIKNTKDLAFDHLDIIFYAKNRLKSKLEYTNIVYSLLKESFTLTQLQRVYEIILDKEIDKRNFRKKFEQLGLLIKTDEYLKGEKQRPARLYKFKNKKRQVLKKFF